jgi:hypothetical protein
MRPGGRRGALLEGRLFSGGHGASTTRRSSRCGKARRSLRIASACPMASCTCGLSRSGPTARPRDCLPPASSISALRPARAMPVITALWCGPFLRATGVGTNGYIAGPERAQRHLHLLVLRHAHNWSTRVYKLLNVLSACISSARSRPLSTSSNHSKYRRAYWSGQGKTYKPTSGCRRGSPSPVA